MVARHILLDMILSVMGHSTDNGGGGPTVLVVDDERELADLYTEWLSDEYSVRTAYAGVEALERLDSTVEVVLLDRRMPELSGDEVLERIRDGDVDPRVIMVTAVDPDVDIIDLPFDDYLVKPVTDEVLHDAVERMRARDRHDEKVREAVALASKMATLESKMDIDGLETSDEYAALEARFFELAEELDEDESVDDPYAEFTTEKIRSWFD